MVVYFLLLGGSWWYLIGRVGWDSVERRLPRWIAALGAAVCLFTSAIDAGGAYDTYYGLDQRYDRLTMGGIIQYLLVAILSLGALLCVVVALIEVVIGPAKVASRR